MTPSKITWIKKNIEGLQNFLSKVHWSPTIHLAFYLSFFIGTQLHYSYLCLYACMHFQLTIWSQHLLRLFYDLLLYWFKLCTLLEMLQYLKYWELIEATGMVERPWIFVCLLFVWWMFLAQFCFNKFTSRFQKDAW